jgi:hypothetical protein
VHNAQAKTETTWSKALAQKAQDASRGEARLRFLDLRHWPTALEYEEAGWIVHKTPKEVAILVAEGHLELLGDPAPNGRKQLLTADVVAAGSDPEWNHEAARIIAAHWRRNNEKAQKQQRGKTS